MRRLIGVVGGAGVTLAAGGAIAIAASGGPTPPPKPLDRAVHDALAGPKVTGVTARITFTNKLVDSSGLGAAGPLLSGATGRLWADQSGRMRLELQSSTNRTGGDVEAVVNGDRAQLYDPSSNTVYRATLPPDPKGREAKGKRADAAVPSMARIDSALRRLGEFAGLSAAQPGNTAGRPSYTVNATPKKPGSLLGGVAVTWDAANATPLKASVTARGSSAPVLALEATDISFGPVASSVFDVSAPKGAKVVNAPAQSADRAKERKQARDKRVPDVTGAAAVSRRVGFTVSAPDQLAGLRRDTVRLVGSGTHASALVTYGRGPGAVAVLQSAAGAKDRTKATAPDKHGEGRITLPTVTIGGVRAQKLQTALGSVLRFRKGKVDYVVAGSVEYATVESVARGL